MSAPVVARLSLGFCSDGLRYWELDITGAEPVRRPASHKALVEAWAAAFRALDADRDKPEELHDNHES